MLTRRFFLHAAALGSAAFASRLRAEVFAPQQGAWRRFAMTTRLDLPEGKAAQAWIPTPSLARDAWMKPLDTRWTSNASTAAIETDPRNGARALHLVWRGDEGAPFVEATSEAMTRDRSGDAAENLSNDQKRAWLAPTRLIPTDGIVRETADKIIGAAKSDEAKARALYEWVVENTWRRASTRGCGVGDIVAMLKSGDLGGKCADINALYVGLARASGLPARDLYGIRVAPSRFGYKSLGANSETITKAQHCRAEVHLEGRGWVAVDPADVRKVVLEEPGPVALGDPKAVAARHALFGASEGNWIAYNDAHDVVLAGAAQPQIDFLMYPQAEVAGVRLDCLDPDSFRYGIKTKEIAI
ncbi:MAG: transglutaminase domain-containing protein [Hyphomicrobiales bacterium]|nr:transglutaminase domain-containing protein [Hyphomicrobiales bacterium]